VKKAKRTKNCDSGSAFIPVPLEDLFYQSLPADDQPVYHEAFANAINADPKPDPPWLEDPNEEAFGELRPLQLLE
jgi:hypothetical protein